MVNVKKRAIKSTLQQKNPEAGSTLGLFIVVYLPRVKHRFFIQGRLASAHLSPVFDHNKKICLLIVSLLLVAGCSNKPYIIQQTAISVLDPEKVYVVNHGWHTGFVVPAHTIVSQLPALEERFNNAPYLEFGWGDKGFYQAEEITSRLTMQAIFWPTASVMHVVAVTEKPGSYFSESDIKTLCLNKTQYALLISFIINSFYKDNFGHIVSLKGGIYGNSQFYKGVGDYHLWNTCNKWTAKGLKSAGLDIQPILNLSAESIMSFMSKQNSDLSECLCSAPMVE